MKHPAWSAVMLTVASCIASANTTVIQAPGAATAQPAAAEAPKAAAANAGQCYALDAAARHECIYAALVRSRMSKSQIEN